MARYLGPKCRISRRYGKDLEFKVRDLSSKCALSTPPGQHGTRRKRPSNYGLQLAAKQVLRYKYGLTERSFRLLYEKSSRLKGETGVFLLQLLESRLDNLVYRMGFASTRAEARQLVLHKAISVYGHTVNIPSISLRPGAVISVKEKAKNQTRILEACQQANSKGVSAWLEVDSANMVGTFKRLPDRDELPSDVDEQLVVELYSK